MKKKMEWDYETKLKEEALVMGEELPLILEVVEKWPRNNDFFFQTEEEIREKNELLSPTT